MPSRALSTVDDTTVRYYAAGASSSDVCVIRATSLVWSRAPDHNPRMLFNADLRIDVRRGRTRRADSSPADRANDVIHTIATRTEFDALFQQGASVTAGTPSELKFLIDRAADELYFLPPAYVFHFDFYQRVLHGQLDNAEFNERAYNRPDRDFIAGTVTVYDSFVDPTTGRRGAICFSLWPTDRFDVELLSESHAAISSGLTFLTAEERISFRVGGPIQDRLAVELASELEAARIDVKTNLQISDGLTFMALSLGSAIGTLVVIERGAAMPTLRRTDVALFLGDVPPDAPPVAAMITTQVQTYNSHLGIKYRQDDIPFFYKFLTDSEVAELRALGGKPIEVTASAQDGTLREVSTAEAAAYLEKIKPKGHVRLTPNLAERCIRPYSELLAGSVREGRWNSEFLSAYGRKTMGVVQLATLDAQHRLSSGSPTAPKVTAPEEPFGVPAHFYHRFIRCAEDNDGDTFSKRLKKLLADPRFLQDAEWQATKLDKLRKAIRKADVPDDIVDDLRAQLVEPYLAAHPGAVSARLRSSAPVVEDSGSGTVNLPNMAGAFDSHTARWDKTDDPAETVDNATEAIVDALTKDYAAVFNDRAVAEFTWNNVDLDEGSVTMGVLVMPNEDDEKANGVLRVNDDLAGFFSITGETQYGENLVTNPEAGATPDTWIDGNYDVLNGQVLQDIEYERVSNRTPIDPSRVHAFTDAEINVAYDAIQVIRDHFAGLEDKDPQDYLNECEVKVLKDGSVQFKQERPWVE
jgi:hypothetical protein